jgi:ketosteroid isomerase-like protein
MDFLEEDWEFRLELQYREVPEDPETAEKNRKILLDALDALVAGDAEAFWSIFDPDVVFYEAPSLPYGGVYRGLEATKAAGVHISAAFASMRTVFEAVAAARDIVMVYQTISFRTKETGNTAAMPVSELYRFRNGKVVEWRALYFDAAMVTQAITGAKS